MTFSTTTKRIMSSGTRSTASAMNAQLEESVLPTVYLVRNGEFGEEYISKTDLFLESLTGIKVNRLGQTPGNI